MIEYVIQHIPNNVFAKNNTAFFLMEKKKKKKVVCRKCVGWLLELPFHYEIS